MKTTSIIFTIFAFGFVGFALYQEKKYRDLLKQQTSVKEIQKGKTETYLYIALIILSLVVIGVSIFIDLKNHNWEQYDNFGVLFLMIAAVAVTILFNHDQSSGLHYTKNGFFLQDQFVVYKKIRNINYKNKRQAVILLKDGTEYKVHTNKALLIEEKLNERSSR